MPSFNEALNMNPEDVKRPPILPRGHYDAAVTDVNFGDISSAKGEWDTVDIQFSITGAGEDVDEDLLAEFGNPNGEKRTLRFMLDRNDQRKFDGGMFRLKKMLLDHLGVEGSTMKELLDNAKGHACRIEVSHRPNPDNPEIVYDEIRGTQPLD